MASRNSVSERLRPSGSPVLVTGAHRSGTTWVGEVLALAPGTCYLHEPFNATQRPQWLSPRMPHWFQYVCDDNEQDFASAVDSAVALHFPVGSTLLSRPSAREAGSAVRSWYRVSRGRRTRARTIVKDPLALFSGEWLARRYGAAVVLTVRHPAAFASSVLRLGWRFDFDEWLSQPLLMRDLLSPWEDEIQRAAAAVPDPVEEVALLWRVLYGTAAQLADRNPDWVVRRHEDLAADPVPGFRDLYARLQLTWSEDVQSRLEMLTSSDNVADVDPGDFKQTRRDSQATTRTWRTRLSDDEVTRLRTLVETDAARWYGPDTWTGP